MYLFITILIGLVLRLAYIMKPEGLWNDEYVSWMIASIPFNEGFWQGIIKQCHMPLYYLYLKPFGSSDTVLRISSVIPGVISIWIMYQTGLLKDKFTARVLALMTAISAFLIYYSQEVRFYSLLFMFSAMSLYYIIKLTQKQCKTNITGYIISSLMILLTHTIGFVYVFFTNIYVLSMVKFRKSIIIPAFCILLLTFPPALYILLHSNISQWWGMFSERSIIFMFTDFFSPILTNNINIPSVILYRKGALFALWLLVPAITAVFFIIKSLIRENSARYLFLIALLTTAVLSIAAAVSKIVFITKYNIEILPILMYLFAAGISLSKPVLRYGAVILWCFFQLSYLFTPDYPSKIPRKEGNRLPAMLIKQAGVNAEDKLIITYYRQDRFSKYYDLSKLDITNIDKAQISGFVSDNKKIPPIIYLTDRTFVSGKIEKLINPNRNTYILFLDSTAFFSEYNLAVIGQKQEYIDKIHPLYLELSVFKNEILNYGKKHNLDVKFSRIGAWSLVKIPKRKGE